MFVIYFEFNTIDFIGEQAVGTFGYSAPEYLQTGRLTAKSDIWSYGVVLYELITGRPPIDHNLPKSEQRMLDWVRPYIADPRRFKLIIDPRIREQCSVKSAYRLSIIANKCLSRVPKNRPKMSQVLTNVQEIVNRMEMEMEMEMSDPPQSPLLSLGDGNQEAVTDEVEKKESSSSYKEQSGNGHVKVYLKKKLTGIRSAELWGSWKFWRSKHDQST